MKVIKKMNPGMPGTKKYLEKYGKKLLCVRYRYDEETKEQLTTIEYVVNRKLYPKLNAEVQRKLDPHPNRHVLIKVDYHEEELRRKIKMNGGIWIKDKRMWKIPCHKAYVLGVDNRIQEII
ncbi:hypothetical protein [Kaarinaea lacus]